MNQLFYKNCKIILISLTSFWVFSAIATCPDVFSPEKSHKEPIKKESSYSPAQKHVGIEIYTQFVKDVVMSNMTKAHKKYQEALINNKISKNPDDYRFVKIEGLIWFKHNLSPKDTGKVRFILAEQKDLNKLSNEIIIKISGVWEHYDKSASRLLAILGTTRRVDIPLLWEQFGGSIDKLLSVREEVLDLKNSQKKNHLIKLIEKHFGPNTTDGFLKIVAPVLTFQETYDLIKLTTNIQTLNPFQMNTQLTQQPHTKKTDKMKNNFEKQQLSKKIIRIIHLMNPDHNKEDRPKFDW